MKQFSKKIFVNQIDKAYALVGTASRHNEDIDLVSGRYVVNARSLMGIFSLDLSSEITVVIHTDDDAAANIFFKELEQVGIACHEII